MNFNVRPSLLARMLFFVGFKLCGVVCCRGGIIMLVALEITLAIEGQQSALSITRHIGSVGTDQIICLN